MNTIKKTLLIVLPCMILAACTPAESIVQTAIAQTQAAAGTPTAPGLNNQALIQTAVVQTLTPAAAAVSTASGYQVQTAVIQTLTALPPPPAAAPLVSPTPETPVPTVTNTRRPLPTITNTVEPFIPSGPITLTGIEDKGDNKLSVNWQAEGSFPNGFYVVWSPRNAEPAFPDDYWTYFANGHARAGVVDVKQPKSYYIRVCELEADRKHCVNYSNVLQFTNK